MLVATFLGDENVCCLGLNGADASAKASGAESTPLDVGGAKMFHGLAAYMHIDKLSQAQCSPPETVSMPLPRAEAP